jgi:hypothetical protein
MMPGPSVEPDVSTAFANSSMASTPPATHHNSVSFSATLALISRATRSSLFGGSLPEAS